MANQKRAIIVGIVVGAAFLLLGGGFIVFAVGGPLVLGAAVGVVAYIITRRYG